MLQITLPDHLGKKLQQAAAQRGKSISELLEQAVEDYLSGIEYDEETDPAIGFVAGPTDLSVRVKEILRDAVDIHSGWTQKQVES
jgi:hypothetical protein